jgi:peptide/nickel transport system ATP-binding protein
MDHRPWVAEDGLANKAGPLLTPLIETRRLAKYFYPPAGLFGRRGEPVRALENVNLHIFRQETLGVVGESGCGKTTLGRVLLRLIPPSAGEVLFEGQALQTLGHSDLKRRRRDMQIVFQNPYSSFDMRFSVLRSLSEPLQAHTALRGAQLEQRARELLEQVGMPETALSRYPHEFSGGQLQRIAVARALALNPKFIVLDEPTSALDVSVQAQILNLLQSLQRQFELTYLLISHDLAIVEHISQRVAVMYLGKVVELIDTETLFTGGLQHPYTQLLMASIPEVYPSQARPAAQATSAPEARPPAQGCPFAPRCPFVMAVCREQEPPLLALPGKTGHAVACHLVNH